MLRHACHLVDTGICRVSKSLRGRARACALNFASITPACALQFLPIALARTFQISSPAPACPLNCLQVCECVCADDAGAHDFAALDLSLRCRRDRSRLPQATLYLQLPGQVAPEHSATYLPFSAYHEATLLSSLFGIHRALPSR
eukprot:2285853-Pleurochrysis_carterae.AAC.1